MSKFSATNKNLKFITYMKMIKGFLSSKNSIHETYPRQSSALAGSKQQTENILQYTIRFNTVPINTCVLNDIINVSFNIDVLRTMFSNNVLRTMF